MSYYQGIPMDRDHYDKLSGEEKLAFLEIATEHLTIDEKAKLVKKLFVSE
jgi:hypothetical protein